jgi:hypothetical protein
MECVTGCQISPTTTWAYTSWVWTVHIPCTYCPPLQHEKHDRNVILIKTCPICFKWFTTNDIVVASCGHMYHPFCLFTHLQTLITCVVEFCPDHVFHPDWWWSMGINILLEEQMQASLDLHLVQQWQQWFQDKVNHMQQEGKHFIY